MNMKDRLYLRKLQDRFLNRRDCQKIIAEAGLDSKPFPDGPTFREFGEMIYPDFRQTLEHLEATK